MSLINREALLAEYDRVHVGEPGKARKLIEDAPTIEPEIVRCKDCRHNHDCNIQYHAQAGEEFYCGAAERREE